MYLMHLQLGFCKFIVRKPSKYHQANLQLVTFSEVLCPTHNSCPTSDLFFFFAACRRARNPTPRQQMIKDSETGFP